MEVRTALSRSHDVHIVCPEESVKMPRGRADAAISDVLGTMLLVLAVVLAGGGLSVLVASNLRTPDTPTVSLALSPVLSGDATLRLVHRNGDELSLSGVTLYLARAAGALEPVLSTSWTTPVAGTLRAGDTLTIPLSPVVTSGEALRILVIHAAGNVQLANLATTAPSASTPLPAPTLSASILPSTLVADASTASLITVRVSHPLGALGVASVRADLTNLSIASNSANTTLLLSDTGAEGDALGGDGVWSGLLRASMNTSPGTYSIPLTARDVAGYDSAQTVVTLTVSTNFSALVAGLAGLNTTQLNAGAISNISAALGNLSVLGNLTSLLANLTGNTPGVVVLTSTAAGEGTRLAAPTSQNLSSFHITNWSWDRANPATLTSDAAVVRMQSGGYAWSVYMRFGYVSSTPSLLRIEMWNGNSTAGRTIYLPSNGSHVSLQNLNLNMTDPTQNGFVCSSQCAPPMTYKDADLRGAPVFSIAYMRDEGNNPDTSDLGIFSMEAVLR